jgi:uncharacterized protein YllA (UPF0747 family)
VRHALEDMFQDRGHLTEAVELFVPRSGETLVRSLSRALTSLLGEHGLVVVEPEWVRGELSRCLARVLSADVPAALIRGARELQQHEHEVAIDPGEAALLFRVDAQGRHALRLGGDGFRYDGEEGSRTGAELAAEILERPDDWSPGALLRPLVQDLALPSAAYVGGLGELAYHAELGPARDAVGLPRLPFVPRISITLVEPDVRASLERLSLGLRAVLEARGDIAALVAEEPPPPAIAELRASAAEAVVLLRRHDAALSAIDPSLGPNLARTASQVKNLVEKLLTKAARVYQNSSGQGQRHVRRLANTFYPRDKPQERVLGPFQFCARWGRGWIDALFAELPAIALEHIAVHFEEETP